VQLLSISFVVVFLIKSPFFSPSGNLLAIRRPSSVIGVHGGEAFSVKCYFEPSSREILFFRVPEVAAPFPFKTDKILGLGDFFFFFDPKRFAPSHVAGVWGAFRRVAGKESLFSQLLFFVDGDFFFYAIPGAVLPSMTIRFDAISFSFFPTSSWSHFGCGPFPLAICSPFFGQPHVFFCSSARRQADRASGIISYGDSFIYRDVIRASPFFYPIVSYDLRTLFRVPFFYLSRRFAGGPPIFRARRRFFP